MATTLSRRTALASMASAAGLLTLPALAQGTAKPMRGVMPIVVTPYTPFFIQPTIRGAPGARAPSVDLMVRLAREFQNFPYIREKPRPLVARMKAEVKPRPPLKSVFGATGGDGWLYELRLGLDGEMTAQGMYADVMVAIWNHYQAGRREQAADAFAKLLLMQNCEAQIPGTERYIFKKRGVFKSTASRRGAPAGKVIIPELPPDAIAEIEFRFA